MNYKWNLKLAVLIACSFFLSSAALANLGICRWAVSSNSQKKLHVEVPDLADFVHKRSAVSSAALKEKYGLFSLSELRNHHTTEWGRHFHNNMQNQMYFGARMKLEELEELLSSGMKSQSAGFLKKKQHWIFSNPELAIQKAFGTEVVSTLESGYPFIPVLVKLRSPVILKRHHYLGKTIKGPPKEQGLHTLHTEVENIPLEAIAEVHIFSYARPNNANPFVLIAKSE